VACVGWSGMLPFYALFAECTVPRQLPALEAGGGYGSLPWIRSLDPVGWRDRPHGGDIRMFSVIRIAGLAVNGHPGAASDAVRPRTIRHRCSSIRWIGGAVIKIIGTGFMPGMVAMFDGIRGTAEFDSPATSFTTFYTETPAHAVGTVDLVLSNPDGQSHRVAAGYTYAPPDSFDPNGVWSGFSLNGTDTLVEFVIEGSRLVSASCTYDTKILCTFTELPSVHDSEFSVVAEGGATISGRIVSALEMAGTISVPSCTTTPLMWRASRQSD
jgi:hypothetical protein